MQLNLRLLAQGTALLCCSTQSGQRFSAPVRVQLRQPALRPVRLRHYTSTIEIPDDVMLACAVIIYAFVCGGLKGIDIAIAPPYAYRSRSAGTA